ELQVGAAFIRLDGDTSLEVLQLDDDNLRLHLHYGSASIRVLDADSLAGFELSTPEGRVTLQEPGEMRIDAALEFSFFLSMPTMIAATGYDLLKTFHPKHGAEALGRMPVDGHEWFVLVIGFVVSFIVALAVVAWFMNWVRWRGFTPFAIYRIIVGIAVLVWVMRGSAH
ncbi:MAG: undecaprenyl-diphosphate phosphatase, partial [Candidatus Angelobacter sp.]